MLLPAGFFHVQGTVRDSFGGRALRVMDVEGPENRVTGLIQFNANTSMKKDSQLWKVTISRAWNCRCHKIGKEIDGTVLGRRVRQFSHCYHSAVQRTKLPCGRKFLRAAPAGWSSGVPNQSPALFRTSMYVWAKTIVSPAFYSL